MGVCIFGAGSIGGYLAAGLATVNGAKLPVVARGAHLQVVENNGLRLLKDGAETIAVVRASSNKPAELGPQEWCSTALRRISPGRPQNSFASCSARKQPSSPVKTACHGGTSTPSAARSAAGSSTRSTGGGRQWEAIGPERAIGCSVYPAAEIAAPGVIEHVYGDKLARGEPNGETTDRVTRMPRFWGPAASARRCSKTSASSSG